MRFYAYHGVNADERSRGQRFTVDVRIAADLAEAGRTDDLDATVNYSAVYQRVRAIVEGDPRSLIETVAAEIAETILREYSRAETVSVTVRKPEVGIKGSILDAAGVTIVRRREG